VKGVISLQAIGLNGFHATPPFYHLPGITILWLYGLILQVLLQQTIRSIVAMPQKDRIYEYEFPLMTRGKTQFTFATFSSTVVTIPGLHQKQWRSIMMLYHTSR
jgi:hypothetical protein